MHIMRVVGGKGDVHSMANAGLIGCLSLPEKYTQFNKVTKICRAELGTPENYSLFTKEYIAALENAGYDDPIKIGMLAAHQGQIKQGQVYPQIRNSLFPCPIIFDAKLVVVVADDFWAEKCVHEKYADKRELSEWFHGVCPEEVRIESNKWRSYTHAGHINVHNPHAAEVLAVCAGHNGKGLAGCGGKGVKRHRRLSDVGAGSQLGSHDYDATDDDDDDDA